MGVSVRRRRGSDGCVRPVGEGGRPGGLRSGAVRATHITHQTNPRSPWLPVDGRADASDASSETVLVPYLAQKLVGNGLMLLAIGAGEDDTARASSELRSVNSGDVLARLTPGHHGMWRLVGH